MKKLILFIFLLMPSFVLAKSINTNLLNTGSQKENRIIEESLFENEKQINSKTYEINIFTNKNNNIFSDINNNVFITNHKITEQKKLDDSKNINVIFFITFIGIVTFFIIIIYKKIKKGKNGNIH